MAAPSRWEIDFVPASSAACAGTARRRPLWNRSCPDGSRGRAWRCGAATISRSVKDSRDHLAHPIPGTESLRSRGGHRNDGLGPRAPAGSVHPRHSCSSGPPRGRGTPPRRSGYWRAHNGSSRTKSCRVRGYMLGGRRSRCPSCRCFGPVSGRACGTTSRVADPVGT